MSEYRPGNLVKLDILINGDPCDALSSIVHKEKSQYRGRILAAKLKELIPRQMFEVAIQAAIGNNVVCRCEVQHSALGFYGRILLPKGSMGACCKRLPWDLNDNEFIQV